MKWCGNNQGTDWGDKMLPTDNWFQYNTHYIQIQKPRTMFGDFKSSFKSHGPFLLPAADLLYLINLWPKSMTKSYDNMSITLARLIPSKLMISPQIKTLISGSFIILSFFPNLSAIKFPPFHPIYAGYFSPFLSFLDQF